VVCGITLYWMLSWTLNSETLGCTSPRRRTLKTEILVDTMEAILTDDV
jgi:hypothetical protein